MFWQYYKTRLTKACLLTLGLLLGSGQAEVSVRASKTNLDLAETIELEITANSPIPFNQQLLNPVLEHFHILGQSRLQETQLINGKQTQKNTLAIRLKPIRSGRFTLPPLSIGRHKTNALEFMVTAKATSKGNLGNLNFALLGSVDQQSVFVGSEVIYSFKILHKYRIIKGQINPLKLAGIDVKTIVKEKRGNTYHQGQNYPSIEWRYSFIPNRSGQLAIPSLGFSGIVETPQGHRNLNLSTQPVNLNVKPQHPSWPDTAEWLPAQSLTIWEKWQPSQNQWQTNQPISRTIEIQAKGINAAQLPNLKLDSPATINRYPQQPKRQDRLSAKGRQAKLTLNVDYIATSSGSFTIPTLQLPWWDTVNQQLRYASLPSRLITVKQGAGNTATISAATDQTPNPSPDNPEVTQIAPLTGFNISRLILLTTFYTLLVVILTLSISAWLRRPKKRPSEPVHKQLLLEPIEKAYQQQQLTELYNLLLKAYRKQNPNSQQHSVWQALFRQISQHKNLTQPQFEQIKSLLKQPKIKPSVLPELYQKPQH